MRSVAVREKRSKSGRRQKEVKGETAYGRVCLEEQRRSTS